LTAVVEVDVAVDVDSIVDLDLDLDVDRRSPFFDEDPETARRSTYKVKEGVNVHVAVQGNASRQGQRPREDVPRVSSTRLHRIEAASAQLRSPGAPARAPDDLAAQPVVRC
jgi:hypothetical protein